MNRPTAASSRPSLASSRSSAAPSRLLVVALLAVLVAFSAQQMLTPILPPLSRQLGLSEIQLGLIITVAAALVAVLGPVWGRLVDSWGPLPALAVGVGAAAVGLALFATTSQVIVGQERNADTLEYVVLIVARGLVFGAGIAAVPVAALAAASVGSSTAGRTRAVSLVGAAQAMSLIVGPAIGGAVALFGLVWPLWTATGLLTVLLVALLLVNVRLVPRGRSVTRVGEAAGSAGHAAVGEEPGRAVTSPGPGSAADSASHSAPGLIATEAAADQPVGRAVTQPLSARDPRVWPLLATGFGLFLSLGLVLFVLGFLVQDRLGLDDEAAAPTVGLLLVVTGVALALVQGVAVPRLGWSPSRLLRVGTPIAVVALLTLSVAGTLPALIAASVLLAVGLGTALPGYTSAPTLLAREEEQGRVAGWVSAVNASTFVVGPLLGSALYTVATPIPSLVAALVCSVVLGFLLFHPGLRRVWEETSAVATGRPAEATSESARRG